MEEKKEKKIKEITVRVDKVITSEIIMEVLRRYHKPNEWGFFKEMRIGTGYGRDAEQRLDAWAINYFPSKKNVIRTFEIKVSRADFISEIKNPLKRRNGLRLGNEFYFVTPENLCDITDIPVECGLMEYTRDEKIKIKIPAPFRDIEPPTWLFLASIARRSDRIVHGELNEKITNPNLMVDRITSLYIESLLKVLNEQCPGHDDYSKKREWTKEQKTKFNVLKEVINNFSELDFKHLKEEFIERNESKDFSRPK